MKKLIPIALALGAIAATVLPASAQSYDPSVGSGNIVSGAKGGLESGRSGMSSRRLYNYAPGAGMHRHWIHREDKR